MPFDIFEFKEQKNIIPIPIKNKKEYYFALDMIGYATTGRVDAQIVNIFLQEAAQLLTNAIVLFEKGYFDNASYSLRQSLEIATTMIYLIELKPEEKEEKLKAWKRQQRFPFQVEMLKFLDRNKQNFFDVKETMSNYFEEIEKVKRQLNKIIHKQGYETFYIMRMNKEKLDLEINNRLLNFLFHLEKCIGAIAVMRLSVDPFPVLLMEREIYTRTKDLLIDPYPEKFVDKYIGLNYLESYRETLLYKEYYEQIMQWEEASSGVLNIIKYQFIERERLQEINEQKHLLSINARISLAIAKLFEHVAYIYINKGALYYFTDTKSNRLSSAIDSRDFNPIKDSSKHFNNSYKGAFLSYLKVLEDDYFIEHNQKLSRDDIKKLFEKISGY